MPHCAVIWCNNQSKNVNKQNSGVSYHKFPNNPYVKVKWIRATGKCNWCPQKHDTICSEHFEADSFMKKSSKTYLLFDAIPTLQLHPIFDEIDSLTNSNNSHNTADLAPPKRRRKNKDPAVPKPAKRRKKENPPDLAPAILIKEEDPPHQASAIRMNEDPPDLTSAIHIKEEDPPDQEPAIRIKEEEPPDQASAIRMNEDPPDLTSAIHIKEEDPPDQEPAIRIKEEDPPNLAPAKHMKEEDPLALIEVTVEKLHVEPADESQAKREAYYTPNPQDSRQTRHLKLSLIRAQDTIKRQRLQVKRIRESNRRLIKKVAKMENIITCLREQSAND